MDFDKLNRKLEGLGKASRNGFRVRNLHEIMNCSELWILAYTNIYNNQGAMTKGIDEITLDGTSIKRIDELKTKIKSGNYRPKPVRRTYIPKNDGEVRPLGVPSGDDKLVQSVVKILLESIYEPVFSKYSHGFRPSKSCHTALMQVKRSWTGVKWFIEFDIKGFFDNVNHDILIYLLEKKIDDRRFIKLVKSFLRAGYMEDWKYNQTYSGTPQGGIISPILSNIYLHSFDIFMDKLILEFDRGKIRPSNPEYVKIMNRRYYLQKSLVNNKSELIIDELKALQKELQAITSMIENTDKYKRLRYCRYADDFICGVAGSYKDATEIMQTIKNYLEDMHLNLSDDKTQIIKADRNAMFLGYNIRVNKQGRTIKLKSKKGNQFKRKTNSNIILSTPKEKVIAFCNKQGYGDWTSKKSTHRGKLITSSEAEILETYNAELRGFANYYKLARHYKHELSALFTLAFFSLLKTLAGKRKCRVKQVLRSIKTSKGYFLKVKTKNSFRNIPLFQLSNMNRTSYHNPDILPLTAHYYTSGTELIRRIEANQCEYCGDANSDTEVHHIQKLKEIRKKKSLEHWEKVMIARNRKTLILCKLCHNLLHQGKLSDKRFKPKKT